MLYSVLCQFVFFRQSLNFWKIGISSEYFDLNIKYFATISMTFSTFVFILTVYSCMPSVFYTVLSALNLIRYQYLIKVVRVHVVRPRNVVNN